MGRATIIKDALTERNRSQNTPTVKGHMLLPTKGVQRTKNKHLDNMWRTIKNHMLPFYAKTRLSLSPRIRQSHFSRTTCEICSKRGHSSRSATGLLHKFPQEAIDKKSSMCRKVSEAAKTHLGIDIAGSTLFDAIGHLRPPAPSAPKPKTSLQIHLIHQSHQTICHHQDTQPHQQT